MIAFLIAVLFALTLLHFIDMWTQSTGRHTKPVIGDCLARVHLLMLDLYAYANSHGEVLPASLSDLRSFALAGVGPDRAAVAEKQFDMMLACPIAEYRGTLRALDGFEYVGEGLRIAHLRHPEVVPVLFDRAGNHPDNSRCVGFANWSEDELTEAEFRQALVRPFALARTHRAR